MCLQGPGRGRKKTNYDALTDAEKPFSCERKFTFNAFNSGWDGIIISFGLRTEEVGLRVLLVFLHERAASKVTRRQRDSLFHCHVYIWWSHYFSDVSWWNFQHSCMKMVILSWSLCRCKSFPDLDEVYVSSFELFVDSTWCRVAEVTSMLSFCDSLHFLFVWAASYANSFISLLLPLASRLVLLYWMLYGGGSFCSCTQLKKKWQRCSPVQVLRHEKIIWGLWMRSSVNLKLMHHIFSSITLVGWRILRLCLCAYVFSSLFFLVGLRKKGSAFFPIACKLYSCRCKTLPGMRYSTVWSRTSRLGLHHLVERECVGCVLCRGVSESKTSMSVLLPFLYCGYGVPSTVADWRSFVLGQSWPWTVGWVCCSMWSSLQDSSGPHLPLHSFTQGPWWWRL